MAELVDIKTIPLDDRGVSTHGIMISVNTELSGAPPSLIEELSTKIKLHRLISPPDTSVLVVSVIGPLDVSAFRDRWTTLVATDSVLRFFLQEMRTAVLVHGKRDGTILQELRLGPS